MEILCCVLGLLWILTLVYLLLLKWQLREIKEQLSYRREHQASTSVSIEFRDKDVKRLVQELSKTLRQESQLRLQQDSKEREFKTLIANVSHDLRTPLTVIKGYLQLLEQCDDRQLLDEYMEIITRHTEELDKRIQQLFEYSYWVNYEEELVLCPINAANLLTDILTDFVPVFEEKNITLQLSECCMEKVLGDAEIFRHIVQNLLKNALQYTTGNVTVSLKKVESNSETMVQLAVKNPVEEECDLKAERVFDRFYSGNVPGKQSTGLGLTIVKLLTEKMGGRVAASLENGMFEVDVLLATKL